MENKHYKITGSHDYYDIECLHCGKRIGSNYKDTSDFKHNPDCIMATIGVLETEIITISNMEKGTYYFTVDHCQHTEESGDLPCTHHLPSHVVPREGLEDGIIKNKADLIFVFYSDELEIANPDPIYQA